VSFPLYDPAGDPGPSFVGLLRRAGLEMPVPTENVAAHLPITHGTTVLAIRSNSGVVMAGDRRATSGNLISHRHIDKVFPADRHSGIAIAGAAGPAIEMVKLFQLQLEHYEKVEGSALSLEGKANQLGQMIRNHLGMAMQGLAVVPLFAGYDHRREEGRLFQYDITGGRYEEHNHASTGSGSLHAGQVLKLGWDADMSADAAIDLALSALEQAADSDSATGGPDLIRRIFPIVATIDADGFTRLDDDDVESRFQAILQTRAQQAR
jgi:proteasome beta subunit